MKPRTCDVSSCPLHSNRPVWGVGPSDPICMLIGEAPGADEDTYGQPFVGKSGQELSMYLKRFTQVSRDLCYITNLVKCRPPKNRDPHVEEIKYCTLHYLIPELVNSGVGIIGTVGRVATSWMLDRPVSMEKVHGIPLLVECRAVFWEFTGIVIPLYHPAYGLHSPRQMKDVIEDFTALGRVIRGQLKPRSDSNIELDYRMEEQAEGC